MYFISIPTPIPTPAFKFFPLFFSSFFVLLLIRTLCVMFIVSNWSWFLCRWQWWGSVGFFTAHRRWAFHTAACLHPEGRKSSAGKGFPLMLSGTPGLVLLFSHADWDVQKVSQCSHVFPTPEFYTQVMDSMDAMSMSVLYFYSGPSYMKSECVMY